MQGHVLSRVTQLATVIRIAVQAGGLKMVTKHDLLRGLEAFELSGLLQHGTVHLAIILWRKLARQAILHRWDEHSMLTLP